MNEYSENQTDISALDAAKTAINAVHDAILLAQSAIGNAGKEAILAIYMNAGSEAALHAVPAAVWNANAAAENALAAVQKMGTALDALAAQSAKFCEPDEAQS